MRSFIDAATGDNPVRLIARLTRSEPLIKREIIRKNANRVSFEFDTIHAEMTPEESISTIQGSADRSRLAVLKILTTIDNFLSIARVDEIRDGQWYYIKLFARGSRQGPFAWASSLGEAGYEEDTPLVLDEIRFLFSEDERPLAPVGAAVGNERAVAQAVAEACRFPENANINSGATHRILRQIAKPHKIIVRDVGQASFSSAVDQNGRELFHLDAGWPISYNKKTALNKPNLNVNNSPVILSHWDWDHLHGYHAIRGLADGIWIAPVQRLGPGASFVARNLADDGRLLGVKSIFIRAGDLNVGQCRGQMGNLNQTGLCTLTKLKSGKTVLFVGDADYYLVPKKFSEAPDFIVATHHGADFRGQVVSPRDGGGTCVVSVGKGNGYGHPSSSAIAQHSNAGWTVEYTCDTASLSRGDRSLGPI